MWSSTLISDSCLASIDVNQLLTVGWSVDGLEVSLYQNGTLEGTPSRSRLRHLLIVLAMAALLLNANKHFSKEIALQFLPRFPVLAHTHVTM